MARWALLAHAKISGHITITEPIVYDGLENFSFSQYDPNNINHAVGKHSLFIYDFNFCPLNRKGSMSPRQKLRKSRLEAEFGYYPKNAIRESTTRIFKRLLMRAAVPLIIHSDRHYQYRQSLASNFQGSAICHLQTSSKIARNFKNPLFAVNNIDMQVRHNLAAFKRETIAFAKHSVAMCESFMLNAVYRNYMRPKFCGTHRSDPESSKKSPAMQLGLFTKILTFTEFFSERPLRSRIKIHEEWELLYHHIDPWSRRKIRFFCN